MSRFLLAISMLVTLGFPGTTTLVQAKPDPPTLDGSTPRRTSGRKPAPRAINDQLSNQPNVYEFADAYERAGEPPILILVGLERRTATDTGRESVNAATGNVTVIDAAGRSDSQGRPEAAQVPTYVGRHLSLFAPSGDPQKLKADIEEILLENPDIELVNIDALAQRDRREIHLLSQRNERRAAQLLATKVNAEIVVLIRMIQSPAVYARGTAYRVIVETLEVARGRKIGGFTFDWTRTTDSRMVKRYAQQISRKFIEQFSRWYAPRRDGGVPQKYTVRIIGLEGVGQLRDARNIFQAIDGVKKVRDSGFSSDGGSSIATLRVTYTGRLLDLVYDLQESAKQGLGMKIDASDMVTGSITLIAQQEQTRDRWVKLIDRKDPQYADLRAGFLAEYRDEGSPKIGIIVNRELTDDEKKTPDMVEELTRLLEDAQADGDDERSGELRELLQNALGRSRDGQGSGAGAVQSTQSGGGEGVLVAINFVGGNVVQGGDQGGGTGVIVPANPAQTEAQRQEQMANLLNTRRVENALYKRMINLGLTMVDPNYVRDRLTKAAEKARRIYNEDELPWLLGREAGLDIVILGHGRITDTGASKAITYTFRAVRISDGTALAADVWSGDLSRYGGEDEIDRVIEVIADYAAGNLADQMWTHWQPPRLLTVTLHNAKTQKEVIAVMSVFKQSIPGVVLVDFVNHEAGREGGIGTFTVRHMLSYEKLIKEIAERETKLPFDLDKGSTTRDTLTIRVRDQ